MRILYIAAEHVSGTLTEFQKEHRRRGDECRYITFWHSRWDFPDDICLNLPFMPNQSWVVRLRQTLLRRRGHDRFEPGDKLPMWNPSIIEAALFKARDRVLRRKVEAALKREQLNTFDLIHLDGGLDFTRDARFIHRMKAEGKHVAAFYHGSDMRQRGIIPAVDEVVELRLTSEWDLLEFDSRLRYLYLPFDTDRFPNRDYHFHKPIRIAHATRNPFKGTTTVRQVVEELRREFDAEFVLIAGLSYSEALRRKSNCDIFVDQLTNEGGWGYGMSSVEALAMGMPVVTNIPPQMKNRIGENPFVQSDPQSLRKTLMELLRDEERCRHLASAGQQWVRARHDTKIVGDQLYAYYREARWLSGT